MFRPVHWLGIFLLSVWWTLTCEALADAVQIDAPESSQSRGAQNSPSWKISRTPQRFRLGISAGDQAGGPVRYNTRFPELKGDPHPSSYYHAQAFLAVEAEWGTKVGGVIAQWLTRRDLWHRHVADRGAERLGERWTVRRFNFKDSGLYLGWALGERYREAPWSIDVGLVYDRAELSGAMFRESAAAADHQFLLRLESLSARTRLLLTTTGSGLPQIGLGPEIHLPLWSRRYDGSDAPLYGWVEERAELKNAAAVGLSVIANMRL